MKSTANTYCEAKDIPFLFFFYIILFLFFIVSSSAVNEIDLALWRSAEAIANDKREFMNDGEWELLSIPSRYWQIHQDETNYAHIQFNVLIFTFIIKKTI